MIVNVDSLFVNIDTLILVEFRLSWKIDHEWKISRIHIRSNDSYYKDLWSWTIEKNIIN